MEKEFDRWNAQKKSINNTQERLYFREGEIWWAHVGVNVGYEIDGKSGDFSRPVYSFLALPLTTNAKPNPYRIFIGMIAGKASLAVLSQLRNLDSLRLINKIAVLDAKAMQKIRRAASEANLN